MSVSGTNQGIRPGVCLSTTKPAAPFVGQVIYMSDTDETAVWDGTAWEGLNRSRDRNVIINGAMQVHQRGTSATGNTTGGYLTADRFILTPSSLGTWTQTIESDAPTGSGFRKSLKLLCTTADASPASGDYLLLRQYIEGQNLQGFAKGTPLAKPLTLSFWVKANVTGTFVMQLEDLNNSRAISSSYTVVSSGTWEKKIITFSADTVGELANNENASLVVNMWLAAGSNYTSSSLQTTWGGPNWTNGTTAGGLVNLASATNNYWQITGIQFEAGSVASPFEFEDYGTTLRKCQRYYYRSTGLSYFTYAPTVGNSYSSRVYFPTTMRGTPVVTMYTGANQTGTSGQILGYNSSGSTGAANVTTEQVTGEGFQHFVSGTTTTASNCSYAVTAELG
jgi:hypothetical protein